MKNKFWRDPAVLFVFRFAVVFGVLIFPWPGWNDLYGSFFRGLGQVAFSRDEGKRFVTFAPNLNGDAAVLDTELTLGNRAVHDANGMARVRKGKFDTRSIGWVPTALTIALIVATPIPWRRRAWALIGGLVLVNLFILFSVQAWIWNESPEVALLTFSSFEKQVVDNVDYTLINQLGASFAVPVLIWILVTFNSHDLRPHEGGKSHKSGHGHLKVAAL